MSSAAEVELYISKRPYVKQALTQGIVNYSALARKICREKDIDSLEAVKVAISRYETVVADKQEVHQSRVEKILDETYLTVRTDVSVEKKDTEKSIICAKTENGFTSVVPDGEKALISLESPEKLENVPGVMEFILSSLSARGINVDHLISCREDTHMIIDESNSSEALSLLQEKLG